MPITFLFSHPIMFLAWAAALVVAITVHEFSHALAAYYLGDLTAKDEGRLTLNPAAHLSLLGTLMLLLAGFGWGKPVPYNPYNLKHPKFGPALIAIAGPTSNLIMAMIFGLFLKFGYPVLGFGQENALFYFLYLMILINVILMAFNLIPIPPLDGSKILFIILPDSLAQVKDFLQQYGFYLLIALLFLGGSLLGRFFGLFQYIVEYLFIPRGL